MHPTSWLRASALAALTAAVVLCAPDRPALAQQQPEDVLDRPKHITPRAAQALDRGLAYLARQQRRDGAITDGGGPMGSYPVAMTALAGVAFLTHGDTLSTGRYSPVVRRAAQYLTAPAQAGRDGLITGRGSGEEGRSMHGHGFAMMFLAQCLGDDGDKALADRITKVLKAGVELTGRSQSARGGWLYTPDSSGDEGSITVCQVQALRACRNAGLAVPVRIIRQAVKYIEDSLQPDGGIAYQAGGSGSQPAITAAAVAVLYNAGEYDSQVAKRCLDFCRKSITVSGGGGGFGHWFYMHLYLSQAYWQVGGRDWDTYFPAVRDHLLSQQAADGSWQGDGVGNVYGTAIAVTILSLPYEHVPIYMR